MRTFTFSVDTDGAFEAGLDIDKVDGLADHGDLDVDVAEMMGRVSTQVAPTRAELINMGLLYTPEHGYAAFAVPQFDQFMRRAMPVLVVPPVKQRKKP